MTRCAFLSDIHANLPALEAIIDDLAQFEVDRVIVAGDSINSGPFSVQVLERISALNWSLIRGNHEFYLLDYGTLREPDYRRSFTMPRWLNQTIPTYWRNYLAALPDMLTLYFQDAPPVRVAHGIPGDHFRGIYPKTPDHEAAALLRGVNESTVIIGHTHLPMARQIQGDSQRWQVLNPGSAGLPLDGLPATASYLILDGDAHGWTPAFRRIPYDSARLYAEFERIHYIEACGVVGKLLIDEFRTARLRIIPFGTWHSQHYPGSPQTLERVDEFLNLGSRAIEEFIGPNYRLKSVTMIP